MANIYLVRHAESIANTEGKYQGITYDTDLSELGQKQARALSRELRQVPIEQIMSSPLKRTFQTASLVAEIKNLDFTIEPRIIETNHGLWEGKHKAEIVRNWQHIYRKWLRFPSSVKFPGGEHFLETQRRVIEWWEELITNPKDTLVVSHDNILRIVIAKVMNMKLNRIWKFHLQPTAITRIRIGQSYVNLIALNNMAHLGNMSANLAIHAL